MADGKPVRGYLGRADEELARELERTSYDALCQLEDRERKPSIPADSERSYLGNQLFDMPLDMNRAYAKAVRS